MVSLATRGGGSRGEQRKPWSEGKGEGWKVYLYPWMTYGKVKVKEYCMGPAAVKLSPELMQEAGKYAEVYSRSLSMQIEHWARIGKIAEENPDLPYQFIEDLLRGKGEIDNGDVSAFEFRTGS